MADRRREDPPDEIRPGIWALTLLALGFTVSVMYVALWGWPFGGAGPVSVAEADAPTRPQAHRRWRSVARSPGRPVAATPVPAVPTTLHTPFTAPEVVATVEGDPQLERSRASYRTTGDGGMAMPPFATFEHVGHVASIAGHAPVGVGETCSVRVLPVETSVFNCMVRVVCGDTLLYPDPEQGAGYVACTIDDRGLPSYANDDIVTANDTDPRVEINLAIEQVVVGDEAGDGRAYSATIALGPVAERRRFM